MTEKQKTIKYKGNTNKAIRVSEIVIVCQVSWTVCRVKEIVHRVKKIVHRVKIKTSW